MMTVKFPIPDYVQKVARMLLKEGYKCYLVGGALRDVVLGIVPDDYDLATDAKPEKMLNIFPKSVSTGARFGMVTAMVPALTGEIYEVEVTTFRSEQNYIDGRWPSKVEFVDDLDKDLGRRDFTFNSMALDLSPCTDGEINLERDWEIHDPFNGMDDLNNRIVRAVGTPIERFREDGLRGFRACRLASELDMEIEQETFDAIKESIPVAAQVSMERIRDEFIKLLKNSPKPSKGIELLRATGLLEIFMPELLEGLETVQKKFHVDNVYWHLLHTVDVAPDGIKLAALFHDIGKPRKDMGNGHFYGHDSEGAQMATEIMKRMRFSRAEIDRTVKLVQNHMFFFPYETEKMTEKEKENIRQHEWTDSAVRRFIARVGEENVEDLFSLRVADACSNPSTAFQPAEIELLQKRISEVREKDMALKVTDLKITGNDLMEAGIEKGPEVGRILSALLEEVLDDPMLNTKEKLLEIAKSKL